MRRAIPNSYICNWKKNAVRRLERAANIVVTTYWEGGDRRAET